MKTLCFLTLAGLVFAAGCQTAPVGEYSSRRSREYRGGRLESVHYPRPRKVELEIVSPADRYYNPLIRGWERPPPFGPVNAFTPGV